MGDTRKTRAHRAELLLVLDHPELPLHNNHVEIGVRRRARKRDVKALLATLFMSRGTLLIQQGDEMGRTQHGVSFLHYLPDRLSGTPPCPASSTSNSVPPGVGTPLHRLFENTLFLFRSVRTEHSKRLIRVLKP